MSTIITIDATDQISSSRSDINTNFANLNTDKIETSVLDTDTALTANSDAKVATQKAVKTYVSSVISTNASETVKGVVEEATDAEVTAGTATGATGAKLFVSAAKLATRLAAYVLFRGLFSSGSATKDLADSTAATQTLAHGLGIAPKLVRLKSVSYASNQVFVAEGTWRASTYASTWHVITTQAIAGETSTSYAIKLSENGSTTNFQTATVAVDATNITLTWTKSNTPTGTFTFLWEASA